MAFSVHPVLDVGETLSQSVWYAVSPENDSSDPSARVGACANHMFEDSERSRVMVTAGATPEGPFSDAHELCINKGDVADIVTKEPKKKICG